MQANAVKTSLERIGGRRMNAWDLSPMEPKYAGCLHRRDRHMGQKPKHISVEQQCRLHISTVLTQVGDSIVCVLSLEQEKRKRPDEMVQKERVEPRSRRFSRSRSRSRSRGYSNFAARRSRSPPRRRYSRSSSRLVVVRASVVEDCTIAGCWFLV